MSLTDAVFIALAGLSAGAVNAVIGSGSLIIFPTLLTLGYVPIVANVTTNIGVLPASFAGAFAYRKFFEGKYRHLFIAAMFSAAGGISGALLLLVLPPEWFNAIVPVLIGSAVLLVIFGPRIKKYVLSRGHDPDKPDSRLPLYLATGATGIYGGYFGAGQGIILLSFLGFLIRGGLQRANAYKNMLAAAGNTGAAVVFIFLAEIDWMAVLILAISSAIGGLIGGKYGQRIPENVYRIFIVMMGIFAITYFVLKHG